MTKVLVTVVVVGALLGLYFYSSEARVAHEDFLNSQLTASSPLPNQSLLFDPIHGADDFQGAAQAFAPSAMTALRSPTADSPARTFGERVSDFVQHTIKRGETLAAILSKYGATRQQIGELLTSMQRSNRDAAQLRAGEKLDIEVTPDGKLLALRGALSEQRLIEISRGSDGALRFGVQNRATREETRTARGVINASFAQAALDQGVPYEVIDDVVDLFGSRVEFSRSIQPGDSFVIKYIERVALDGSASSPGYVIAASLRNNGRMLAALRYQQGKSVAQYYDENGEALGDFFLRYPLKFTRISSVFTNARFHPVLKVSRPHNGIDFAAPTGTPVRSVAAGKVVFSGWLRGGGNTIRIKHGDRWTTEYMHLNSIGKNARTGATVGRGEVIGTVGSTGLSTGPHLHFGLFDRGKYVNPLGNAAPRTGTEKRMPIIQVRAMLESLQEQHQLVALDRARCKQPVNCQESHQG